jgi:large subunit ribosomal protein L17
MLHNMATSLITHKRIATTLAKAKALRVYVEPLLTKAKEDTTNSRRLVFAELRSKEAIKELFGEISQKIADRPGGYTRILRTGFRLGDNAEMCIIELVDYNENMLKEKSVKKTRARRSGGAKKTTDATKAPIAAAVETKEEVQETTAEVIVDETPQVTAEEPKSDASETAEVVEEVKE